MCRVCAACRAISAADSSSRIRTRPGKGEVGGLPESAGCTTLGPGHEGYPRVRITYRRVPRAAAVRAPDTHERKAAPCEN